MPIVTKLDEYGRGAWIAFAVLGFIVWWPLGLATLAFLFGVDAWVADMPETVTNIG